MTEVNAHLLHVTVRAERAAAMCVAHCRFFSIEQSLKRDSVNTALEMPMQEMDIKSLFKQWNTFF